MKENETSLNVSRLSADLSYFVVLEKHIDSNIKELIYSLSLTERYKYFLFLYKV